MFKYRSAFTTLVLSLLALTLVSCGGSDFRKTEVYYLVANNIDLPYWQAARAGLLRAAAEVGVAADMVGPETYDAALQKEAFDEIVAMEKPPAGILVSPADPAMMAPSINAAVAKGIEVITIDSDAPDSDRFLFIGTDNYSVGAQSAEVTAERLQNAGNVIVFTISGQTNLEDRLRGYRDIFAQFPAIRIIDTVDIKGDGAVAFDLTKEILAKRRSSVDAYVCLESIACPEVAEVLNRNSVRDKVVIAMDTPQRTLEWIQNGLVHATIAQKPYTMAYTGLRVLADHKKYPAANPESEGSLSTVPSFIDTGATLVTEDNVARFIKDQESTQPAAAPAAE